MSFPHYEKNKQRNTPPKLSPYFSSVTIAHFQLKLSERSSDETIFKGDNNKPDYSIHPGEPCFAWKDEIELGFWTNWYNLKIRKSRLRAEGIKDYSEVDKIIRMLKKQTIFVGFASKNTHNPEEGRLWDEKIAVEISEPKSIRIVGDAVAYGDLVRPWIPNPRDRDNRYLACFTKVDKGGPLAMTKKKLISLGAAKEDESVLANLTW